MHLHFLGICGTFMGSLALLARELGYRVSGSDANVYPPMSTQLENAGIRISEGWRPSHLEPVPDLVVIGNALGRGNPLVEHVLDRGLPYTSGPQWLSEHVLRDRWVLAASGTHGKTTTASMLSWILTYNGLAPGYLIGGVPRNFEASAALGDSPFFVIEADEYDTAFFDKRSKFIHYRPRTLIINNIEFDHADIFDTLGDIERQFHHLVRTLPSTGQIIHPADDPVIDRVLARGCWSERQPFRVAASPGADGDDELPWIRPESPDGRAFTVWRGSTCLGEVNWKLTGQHNLHNALAAILAARHIGVRETHACQALSAFEGVARRLDRLAERHGVVVYDDFAHHPTAIATTLAGLRAACPDQQLVAIIEPRSNTMKMGVHGQALLDATEVADEVIWANLGGHDWLAGLLNAAGPRHRILTTVEAIQARIRELKGPAQVVLMSNGGFAGLPGWVRDVWGREA
ncbi:UDP-N-acetylmuramate:L-alanyl-gamma-D-glutamyl-meso-diaminopimelate ligase [Hahella sp. SMD15-11]|uniref:UDP-N-acetylmuramate--L-alanyl-gamma-D-glutamyl-meso-2,6-diaminoheptandioate ligase n=1 Tax=Thermohahella caldifontis TaxID=3142973 RepID=A0AB39V025_9GAMM